MRNPVCKRSPYIFPLPWNTNREVLVPDTVSSDPSASSSITSMSDNLSIVPSIYSEETSSKRSLPSDILSNKLSGHDLLLSQKIL